MRHNWLQSLAHRISFKDPLGLSLGKGKLLDVPVLLIAYNRENLTQQVVDRLLATKANNVYIAVDGPKASQKQDSEQVARVQELVSSAPWHGNVSFLFRETNLGCRRGVSEAITWFFGQEQEGIILEDDCVPEDSFFPYCEELLATYRDNPQIGMISGATFFPTSKSNPESFTFSRYPHIWGWATWKRAWARYDAELTGWKSDTAKTTLHKVSGGSKAFVKHWDSLLSKVDSGDIDTWDYIWSFSLWKNNQLTVLPCRNLVHNAGFGEGATHTTGSPISRLFNPEADRIDFPLEHPKTLTPNTWVEFLSRELIMGVHGSAMRSLLRIVWSVFNLAKGNQVARGESRGMKNEDKS